jgi:hypothetical protein
MKHKRLSQLSTLLELISEQVDVAALVGKIPFEGSQLIEAALEQPKLHLEAGKLRVQCMHKRGALEAKLSLETSMLAQRRRSIRNPEGKRDNTEGAVKAYVEMQPSVIKLRKLLNTAIAKEELSKQLVDVYRSRKDVIRIIVDSGKISLQAKELAMLKGSAKLRSAVRSVSHRSFLHLGGEE